MKHAPLQHSKPLPSPSLGHHPARHSVMESLGLPWPFISQTAPSRDDHVRTGWDSLTYGGLGPPQRLTMVDNSALARTPYSTWAQSRPVRKWTVPGRNCARTRRYDVWVGSNTVPSATSGPNDTGHCQSSTLCCFGEAIPPRLRQITDKKHGCCDNIR